MITITCDCCGKKPDEDFILSGEIFETRIPYDAVNIVQPKQFKKTPIHICGACFDKYLRKYLKV